MQSIALAKGGNQISPYPPLNTLPIESLSKHRNLVLFIIDGLGYNYLCQHKNSFLYTHLHSKISTVTPPTTAAGVSTFLTGLAPQQHGLTGWFTYFEEINEVLTALPYTLRRNSSPPNKSVDELIGLSAFFDSLSVRCHSIMPRFLQDSTFNKMLTGSAELTTYTSIEQCCTEIHHLCKIPTRKYVYAYWSQFDSLAHEFGICSDKLSSHFTFLDQHIQKLAQQLKGCSTQLLICADHGFIDSPREKHINVNEHPRLLSCLKQPLCGEPRLAFCYIKEGKHQEFENYISQHLQHAAHICASEQLLSNNFFGLGKPHSQLDKRIGDYALIMKHNYTITQTLDGELPNNLTGYHGGLSDDELYVPLVLINC